MAVCNQIKPSAGVKGVSRRRELSSTTGATISVERSETKRALARKRSSAVEQEHLQSRIIISPKRKAEGIKALRRSKRR